jgi:putative OPT family oligopeptide transporter
MDQNNPPASFIPASQNLPEITVKAVILSIILAAILGAANAYLGLKVGLTISASIPAAVVSMGILRLFRKSNILENNIVQTATSASEALVAGIIYVLPALLILHFWGHFHYWETTLIAIIGGILGVFFSIPLRRILLADKHLRFPEGVAIAQVLKVSEEKGGSLKLLIQGGIVGAAISFAQSGLQVISDNVQYWFKSGTNFVYGLQMGFEPAILAAGYIVGLNTALSSLMGITLGWFIGIPILSHLAAFSASDSATSVAMNIWQSQIRYIGVGTMLFGGIWTLLTLLKPISQGIKSSLESVMQNKQKGMSSVPRTERDIPIHYMFIGTLLVLIPIACLLRHFVLQQHLPYSAFTQWGLVGLGVLFIPIVGFIVSSVCGYFAGLVGSSNNPISGLALSALLVCSLLLLGVYSLQTHTGNSANEMLGLAALAVVITTVTTCGAAITNDTIQDLKTGQLVGATPWKQQVMLILGAVASSFIIPPILSLLFNAYGIANIFPHPGMDPSQGLSAPQAALMATLARAVFQHDLPWAMILTGGAIAVVTILIDNFLKTKGTRLPVLAVGFGIYLPSSVTLPVVVGGIASYFIKRASQKRAIAEGKKGEEIAEAGNQKGGLIIACGLVAGSALMGVLLAIPFTIFQSTDILKIVGDGFSPIATTLAFASVAGLLYWIYRVVNQESGVRSQEPGVKK